MISSVSHSLLLLHESPMYSQVVCGQHIGYYLIPRGDGKVPGIHIRSKNFVMCKNRR